MPDNRKNLQVSQPNVVGDEVNDKNGWPVPLTDPSGTLRMVVSDGSRGEQRGFQAMSTSRQNDVGAPEGRSSVPGVKREELSIETKVTKNDSLGS